MVCRTDATQIRSAGSRRVSPWLSAGALLAVLCCQPSVSVADVLWNWSFSTEAGTFVTNGTFAETSGTAVFTFRSFSVSASQTASNVGASYNEGSQPIQTMSWNGSQPTQFTRAGGLLTNGSNFYNDITGYFYTLGAPPVGILLTDSEIEVTTGTLTVVPVGDVAPPPVPAPASSSTGIVFLTGLMLLVGALLLRRQAQASGSS